ncbi:transcription factor 7-like 1-B isoform X1 [Maylandia zebra]
MAAANPGGSPVEKTRHLLGVAAPVGTAPTTKSLSESLSPSVSSSTLSTSTSASSQISSTTFESVRRSWPPRKRKCPAQQDEDGPYVKKPPNAFMLYLKEQRPKVIAELNIPGNAAVNAVVGQRWKSLSNDQKARYFKQAETERQNHAKEHPAWSTKENYVCPTIISL